MEVLIIIIILALFGSAFISASEASIIAVNRVRIRNLSDQGNKKAEAIEKTLEENEKFFGTLLLFGNLLNVLIATLVGTLIINLVGKGSVTSVIIATAISTIIVVTFGELTPKSISTRIADKWSLLVIKIIRGLMFVSTPAVWTFAMIPKLITRTFLKSTIEENPMVTTGELRKLIDLGEEEGTVDVTQGEMLENVFRFGEMQIKDIMTPRPEIVWIDKNISISSFLKIYKKTSHTRFPVCEGSLDDILGIISIKEVMLYLSNEKADINKPISTLMKQCLFSPEMKLLDELLEEFQNTGNKITLAIDEFGEISGLLTLARCLEKIVGESIEENGNNKSKIVKVSNEQFIVDASISINEINDEMNIDIPEGRYETLAGFIIDRLQSIPEKNTTTNYKGYRFTILETSKNKISKIQIRILSMPSRKNVEN
ncbi:MAG: HlyC/CorC family transporter [SAR202 cluster bacterium]|nr:HlyC/CorC family transporter [SAR202 cluster bacterium]